MLGAMKLEAFDGLLLDAAEPRLAPALEALRRGVYEGREVRLVKGLLRPGQRVMELGTCTGLVAMQAARVVGAENVFCYEAHPDNAALARRHFAANGMAIALEHGVLAPRRRMLADPARSVTFHLSTSLVSSALTAEGMRKSRPVEVPLLCLEDEIARHGATAMIVDIEGGEVELLGQSALDGIDAIIMETHYRKAGVRATNDMIAHLVAQGFRLDLRHSGAEVVHLYRAGTGPEAEEAAG
ncbi:FkbM family methyltransferase [Roseomonas sp. AR75]|uniref:FkbM family methyltransferase n=1 Tax=Roseomonas sp. AR75 TaxID=2562311 RepID=UPI0010C06AEA|nr:FkbM family methyltransferase [Roseomonas sp. AR75]